MVLVSVSAVGVVVGSVVYSIIAKFYENLFQLKLVVFLDHLVFSKKFYND